jgi:glycosyltransferase involved in cell wall biosynthesis
MLSTPLNLNLTLILGKPLLPRGTRLLVRESTTASVFLGETQNPKIWTWLYRKLYKKADRIVCLSDWIVDDMVAKLGVPREKMVRIYNPVDINRVLELAETGGNPYSGPGPHVVAAGRLSREKGFDVLLAAMPAVFEYLPDSRLTILGDGPLRDDLNNQMHKLGLSKVVSFLGFQQNPWRYLKHADVFVLPSRYEGLSNILLEVLAIGRPVVATDCPGAVREVQGCDEEMIVVPPEDPVALAEAIVSVCRRSRREHEHLEPARLRLRKFNLQQIIDEYSALLQQVP